MREAHESQVSQVELFLNSVPILSTLSQEEKLLLVDALEEHTFVPATRIISQACHHYWHAALLRAFVHWLVAHWQSPWHLETWQLQTRGSLAATAIWCLNSVLHSHKDGTCTAHMLGACEKILHVPDNGTNALERSGSS